MYHKVGSEKELALEGERLHANVDGRYVTVINHKKRLFCIDSTCYHTGGPLGNGDIEEVHGLTCITCPWHMYQITLEDGAKLYESLVLGPNNKLVPGGWKKKENAQRVHAVERRADGIYVKLNTEGKYDSDIYGTSAMCGAKIQGGKQSRENNIHSRSPFSAPNQLPKRSGHVLNPSSPFAAPIESGSAVNSQVQQIGPPSDNLRSLTMESEGDEDDDDDDEDFLDEEELGSGTSIRKVRRSIPFRVEYVEKDGESGIVLGLSPSQFAEKTQAAKVLVSSQMNNPSSELLKDPQFIYRTFHVDVAMEIDGEVVIRPFTPVHSVHRTFTAAMGPSTPGSSSLIELCVRVYPKGQMGPKLAALQPGDMVHVGPGSSFPTSAQDLLSLPKMPSLGSIYLFAGGSGITPMLQILENIIDLQQELPESVSMLGKVYLVVANKATKDVLGMTQLSAILKGTSNPELVEVIHLLPENDPSHSLDCKFPFLGTVRRGKRIDDEELLQSISVGKSPNQVFLWSGPPGFNQAIHSCLTEKFEIPTTSLLAFEG